MKEINRMVGACKMEEINYPSLLIGKKLTDMGRAADMAWVILEEFNIDIIAAFVVRKEGTPMICSDEMYLETGAVEPTNQRPVTVFDTKVKELLMSSTFVVTEVSVDAENNLSVQFSDGLCIQTTSRINDERGQMCHLFQDEEWRIFAQHTSLPHMVARKDGIRFE